MQVLRELLQSKKFITGLIGMLTALGMTLGMEEVKIEQYVAVLSPLIAVIAGFGAQDVGKAAVQMELEAQTESEEESEPISLKPKA